MFLFPTPSIHQTLRCFVTHGTMSHPNPDQLPAKAKPWSAFLSQAFVHKVDLILPDEVLQLVKEKILNDMGRAPSYQRVFMTLGQVLEGDFFTQYIKIGNIMMLSEGKIDLDNVFSIKDGQLTMYLDQESYERVGLVGKPQSVKGSRGLYSTWIVEYDLRSPSALHGRKGFDRLVYACKNALSQPTFWLFCNLSHTPSPDPIAKHPSTRYTSNPGVVQTMTKIPELRVPSATLADKSRQDFDEYATDVYEWLSLVRLESPRVKRDDNIDPYLSTYTVPGGPSNGDEAQLCKISWQGFIPPRWVATTLANLIKTLPPKAWFSFSATPITCDSIRCGGDCTILRPPSSPGEYVLWEIKEHNERVRRLAI
ncbi:ribonuclease P 40kDa subunit [Nemania sp. FL0916]|nr:ribonuclease P 40kDa subunit [Nemania sp. FL0916]